MAELIELIFNRVITDGSISLLVTILFGIFVLSQNISLRKKVDSLRKEVEIYKLKTVELQSVINTMEDTNKLFTKVDTKLDLINQAVNNHIN